MVFGAGEGLFGVLSLPPVAKALPLGVLFCGPLWHQNICSYRPLRTLAVNLARQGLPVLRFDWPGIGDSLDARTGSVTPSLWSDAAQQALDALDAHTEVDALAVIGLRIGATLSLPAVLADPRVTRSVLLAPFASGRAFLRELRAFEALVGVNAYSAPDRAPTPPPEGALEAGGFLVTAEEAAALERLDFTAPALWGRAPDRMLITATHADRATTQIGELATEAGAELTHVVQPELAHVWGIEPALLPAA